MNRKSVFVIMVFMMLLAVSYAFAQPSSSEVYVMGNGEILEVVCAHPIVDFSPEQKLIIECLQAADLPTAVPTDAPTETAVSPTATNTLIPTATHTPVATETAVPPTATNTLMPTATNTPIPTATNTTAPTPTSTPVPTATHTPLPTPTNTPLPTATFTPLPTATNTPTPLPTATNTLVPTFTNTPVPTATTAPPTSTPSGSACVTYTSSDTPINMPNGVEFIESSIVVSGVIDTINDVNVSIDMPHAWVGDLIFSVESPNGSIVRIIDQPGVPASTYGCSNNDILATLDDAAALPVEGQCEGSTPTINGTFSPNNALSVFNGQTANGSWHLMIEDTYVSADAGSLDGWSVEICTEGSTLPTSTPLPPTPTASGTVEPPAECVGVIGDSGSYPREFTNTWGVSWVEFANWEYGINFGPALSGDSCNRAYPGNTVSDIAGQVDELEPYITNGDVENVIMFIGANDLIDMCDNNYNTSEYDTMKADMLIGLENGVTDLIGYGVTPNNIFMVDQANQTQEKDCSNASQLAQMVNDLNAEIITWETEHGINVLHTQDAYELVDEYGDLKGDIVIDGHTLTHEMCDEPNCKFVADGHHGTAVTLLIFNALFADTLQVPQTTDQRIAEFSELN